MLEMDRKDAQGSCTCASARSISINSTNSHAHVYSDVPLFGYQRFIIARYEIELEITIHCKIFTWMKNFIRIDEVCLMTAILELRITAFRT